MQSIPFGKFFDTDTDKALIASFTLSNAKDLTFEDTMYLFSSNLTNDYYLVVEAEHGADWEEVGNWAKETLQNPSLTLEEVLPKSPDWYATHHLFRVVSGA